LFNSKQRGVGALLLGQHNVKFVYSERQSLQQTQVYFFHITSQQ